MVGCLSVAYLVFDIDVCAAVDKRSYERQVVAAAAAGGRRVVLRSCRRDDLVQRRTTHLHEHSHT